MIPRRRNILENRSCFRPIRLLETGAGAGLSKRRVTGDTQIDKWRCPWSYAVVFGFVLGFPARTEKHAMASATASILCHHARASAAGQTLHSGSCGGEVDAATASAPACQGSSRRGERLRAYPCPRRRRLKIRALDNSARACRVCSLPPSLSLALGFGTTVSSQKVEFWF